MKEEMKDAMIASVEKVQAVEEFLNAWYSVNDLFETAANAGSVLLEMVNISAVANDDLQWLRKLIDQHVMMANLLKKFEHSKDESDEEWKRRIQRELEK
jgi:GTPase Era involved in 16S rRNA processing